MTSRTVQYFWSYYHENGTLLTLQALYRKTCTKLFSWLLSQRIEGRPSIEIPADARILGLSHIRIGHFFRAGAHLWLEAVTQDGDARFNPQLQIGNNVVVNDFVHIAATHSVYIGDNVLMASRIFISDHHHGSYGAENGSDPSTPPTLRAVTADGSVTIGDNVWLGENVSVLAGAQIGSGCVIGCNSVVTGFIPANSIAVGSPARIVKQYSIDNRAWLRA